ncbi:hypothetical protein G6321_00041670 [Bradyrhizobium barranii subsp. barranii]|uniref:Uncharacterized protein n=1 Tax=Bradyrhizobium barranii subsp. barranii TaxID=2823807 RepID=A0A9X9YML3_9BRAD|nr:hypothetical protein [Bradyrhizobium barranii]UGX92168.1 hypothetical protein G6321_00041670 [Bradyrhizobium barranii subsp. barranii]
MTVLPLNFIQSKSAACACAVAAAIARTGNATWVASILAFIELSSRLAALSWRTILNTLEQHVKTVTK